MIAPKKELGQNFLKFEEDAKKIVSLANLNKGDTVIEIGPGLGILTAEILRNEHLEKVYAIEFDPRMIEHLRKLFSQQRNAEIVFANVLDWLPTFNATNRFKIIGALPYYITSPILHAIVYMEKQPESIVLVIQKEVAQKIVADAPDNSYLAAFINSFFTTELSFILPSESFNPAPKVDSAVIRLMKKTDVDSFNIARYERYLHRAFLNPRKMLNKVFSFDELRKMNVNPRLRPQHVSTREWLSAFKALDY